MVEGALEAKCPSNNGLMTCPGMTIADYRNSRGFSFVVGIDMASEIPDAHCLSWDDPKTHAWRPVTENQAGSVRCEASLRDVISIKEIGNSLFINTPMATIEMQYIGQPFIFMKKEHQPRYQLVTEYKPIEVA